MCVDVDGLVRFGLLFILYTQVGCVGRCRCRPECVRNNQQAERQRGNIYMMVLYAVEEENTAPPITGLNRATIFA